MGRPIVQYTLTGPMWSLFLSVHSVYLKEIAPSPSSSASLIIAFRPRWVCGAPSPSIITFSSSSEIYPLQDTLYLNIQDYVPAATRHCTLTSIVCTRYKTCRTLTSILCTCYKTHCTLTSIVCTRYKTRCTLTSILCTRYKTLYLNINIMYPLQDILYLNIKIMYPLQETLYLNINIMYPLQDTLYFNTNIMYPLQDTLYGLTSIIMYPL